MPQFEIYFFCFQSVYVDATGVVVASFGESPYADGSGNPFSMTTKRDYSAHFVFQKGRFEADGKISGMKPFICQTCAVLPALPEPST